MRAFAIMAAVAVCGYVWAGTPGETGGRTVEERLAAQEAMLRDMQAKIAALTAAGTGGGIGGGAGAAKGVTSILKRGTVTIGGLVETRYFYHNAVTKSSLRPATENGATVYRGDYREQSRRTAARFKYGDLKVAEAKLRAKIDLADNVDAFVQVDLQTKASRANNVSGDGQKYWVRWKNIRDTGFGVLVGRNEIAFGDQQKFGICTGYTGASFYMGSIGGAGVVTGNRANSLAPDGRNYSLGEGMFVGWSSILPHHTGWDYTRTTQVNPYWEGLDGRLRVDVSLFQSFERIDGKTNVVGPDGHTSRSINYGLGSGSARVVWKPVEGLQLTGSVVNFYQNNQHGGYTNGHEGRWGPWNLGSPGRVSANNTAVNLSLILRPARLERVRLWGRWTHGWNEGWVRKMDSDAVNLGVSCDLSDRLTLFAQGDYLYVDNGHRDVRVWRKSKAWALYTALRYSFPYGVNLEAGWRHEQARYSDRGGYVHTKVRLDTAYAHLGLYF